jgi:hypothetical protein
MSTDYSLYCSACRKELETVASGSIAYGDKLWRDKKALDHLQEFLFTHAGHTLIFQDSQIVDDMKDDGSEG